MIDNNKNISYQILKNISIFSQLNNDELDRIDSVMSLKYCSPESYILLEEEETDNVFIISSGTVQVTKTIEDGKEVILAYLEEGEIFGELAAFDGHPRSANVKAQEECELIVISQPNFIDLIRKNSKIGLELLRELSGRIRHLDQQILSLSLLDSKYRIAKKILEIVERNGLIKKGLITLKKFPTHQEIAKMTGTSRETVTRIIKSFKDRGFLYSKGRTIYIPHVNKLEKFVADVMD